MHMKITKNALHQEKFTMELNITPAKILQMEA